MVSSGEEPNKGLDTTAGGLVWVRRRNGSWWPGQILDPDELPEGCVPTARSGTPVKLLGRDDASVDWYNLEKSKRVKAFHCKEYDDCIKRVQMLASQSSNKRSVKYARREDAILHALELENARLGGDRPDTQDHHAASHPTGDDNDFNSSGDDSESGQGNRLGHVDSANKKSKQRETENDSEDDGSKGVKRMRGLEDLGMGVASKRTRKRTQVGHVQELSKRKKRRPLTKVMESATMVCVPTGEESDESKKNSSVVINNNSDSNGVSSENATFTVPTIPENESFEELLDVPVTERKNSAAIISAASRQTAGGGGAQPSRSNHVEVICLDDEECNDSIAHHISPLKVKGTSGWRLKGKRNSRSRKLYLNNKTQTSVAGARSRRNGGSSHNAVRSLISDSGTPQVKSTEKRLLPLRQSRFTVNPKYDNDYSLDNRAASGLFDVKVEVKTSYCPQHVPYISLTSQLTGRPITGHPLQVEVLKDSTRDQESDPDEDVFTPENAGKQKKRGGPGRKRKRKRGSARSQTSQSKSKTNGLLLSKKTRKLSSLTAPHRLSHEKTKPIVEKLKNPSVACVPLTVVFSRINAALTSTMRAPPYLKSTTGV